MKHRRSAGSASDKWHEERRSTVRVPVDRIVAYTTRGASPIIANVSELSNSSLRLVANEQIAVGAKITIAFPSGALLSKAGAARIHVFDGRVVNATPEDGRYGYGIDLVPGAENADDLRWTILQLSLRRTALDSNGRAHSPASGAKALAAAAQHLESLE